ncbi:MAG TPA: thiamine pyrophosphate-binding protein [Gammaproteobacteria bacterium]|nr:thiamine pyrophosphate-binding protein [Gammaproteobacteria bacterium]
MAENEQDKPRVNRRGFLIGTASTAAALAADIASGQTTRSDHESVADARDSSGGASPPSAEQVERDSGNIRPPIEVRAVKRPGSDLIVQTLRDLGVEYVVGNPGSSYEGFQESVINYGTPPNRMPEFITALHEESAVDMANGYGKAEGKPMVAGLHGTIGVQHGSMATYQAFYSGTPLILIAGRDKGFIPAHTADDMAAMVRSYTKWDAQPKTLAETIAAVQEGYRQATTPPTGPVLIVFDMEIQKAEAGDLQVPKFKPANIAGVDATTAREIARSLLSANNPRIEVGRLRTPEGVRRAVELAELTGACVGTAATQGPMSFPQRHPLCGPGANKSYDYTLGLEQPVRDVALIGPKVKSLTPERDQMHIGFGGLGDKVVPNRFGRTRIKPAMELTIDAEASLSAIIDEVRRQVTAAQRRTIQRRSADHARANETAYVASVRQALLDKRYGWDDSPVSTARLYAELWPLIQNEDWCLGSPSAFSGNHHMQLWDHNKPYSYLGTQGAGGMGYGAGACGGAGLAAKHRGRFVINIQTDGDMNYQPGVLWTEVHHKLPVLSIMHNNRAWHQELMFMEFLAAIRGRGVDRAAIGTTLREPFIDYAKMAEAYGMASEGPISDPRKLSAALQRGVASVKRGEPYMIDLITQPR